MAIDNEKVRALLTQRRDELKALSEISSQSRGAVTLDQQSVGRLSRMDAMQQQAMAQATERQRKTDIVRLEAALRRVAEDEYGYCAECGEEIAPKRLDVDPAATHCVGCAGRRE